MEKVVQPGRDRLEGVGVLAGRRYLASGVWYGVDLDERLIASPADDTDLMIVLDQARPGMAYLRALGSDAPTFETELRHATDRIAAMWNAPVRLERFRC